jgi:hypothetical protein
MTIRSTPLHADIAFGSRVTGLTEDALQDPDVRAELAAVFEERALIVFAGVEPTNRLQVAIMASAASRTMISAATEN